MGGLIVVASVVKDLWIGTGLALVSRICWTLYDWNEERKVRRVYDGLLEKGEIYQELLQKGLVGVVAEEGEYEIPVHIMNSDSDYFQSWSFK